MTETQPKRCTYNESRSRNGRLHRPNYSDHHCAGVQGRAPPEQGVGDENGRLVDDDTRSGWLHDSVYTYRAAACPEQVIEDAALDHERASLTPDRDRGSVWYRF